MNLVARILSVVILATLIICALCSCATKLYGPNGKPIATFASDITDGEYTAGTTHFKFAKMSNSAPTRAALLGSNKLLQTVASGATAILIPGSSTTTTIGRAAITAVPHVTAPVPSN